MDIKQKILHLYRVNEKSLREISRELGIDRKIVTRLVNAYEAAVKSNPETGIDEFLSMSPKYKSRIGVPRVLRGSISHEIDKWLKENERRRNNGMRKQCLKCKDIHRELLEKGFSVSYSSVCKYVKRKKHEKTARPKDVYLRIHREPGIECEFDWGQVKLFIGGKSTTLMMAVFCFPYSKGRMAYLFHRQDTLAFMEAHRNFYRDVTGVPRVMVYDTCVLLLSSTRRRSVLPQFFSVWPISIVSTGVSATPVQVGRKEMWNVAWILSVAVHSLPVWILLQSVTPRSGCMKSASRSTRKQGALIQRTRPA